jgi:hypothetical protein
MEHRIIRRTQMSQFSATQKAEQDQPRVLRDEELDVVHGGRKAGGAKDVYLKVTMEDLIVTSFWTVVLTRAAETYGITDPWKRKRLFARRTGEAP